ncbi:MAG: hypothetical protein AB1798_05250, partial [Spirochaetota bacterium]
AFCILEKDKKTFEYFKQYVEFLETQDNACHILDSKIQARELSEHLRINNLHPNSHDEEIANWIEENGQPFRDYLNTIKLVYVVWKCMGKDWNNISWEDFGRIEDNLNKVKAKCLDTIF